MAHPDGIALSFLLLGFAFPTSHAVDFTLSLHNSFQNQREIEVSCVDSRRPRTLYRHGVLPHLQNPLRWTVRVLFTGPSAPRMISCRINQINNYGVNVAFGKFIAFKSSDLIADHHLLHRDGPIFVREYSYYLDEAGARQWSYGDGTFLPPLHYMPSP